MNSLINAVLSGGQQQDSQLTLGMNDDLLDDLDIDYDDDLDDALISTDDDLSKSSRRDQLDEQRQLKLLHGYLSAFPVKAESVESMHQKLDEIVQMIAISAQTRHWEHLLAWDGILASWRSLKYPLPRRVRASLATLYWEIILVPAMEKRYLQTFAISFIKLIGAPLGAKRKLELDELTLPWDRLWETMEREVWPKKGLSMTNDRNVQNIYLRVAMTCSDYFSPEDVPKMLDEFIPLFTQSTGPVVFSIIAAFLPTSCAGLYLPFMFKTWEGFQSQKIEETMLSTLGALAVVHVTGAANDGETDPLPWKDVGIFSNSEWATIMRAALALMNVPVGSSQSGSSKATDRWQQAVKTSSNVYGHLAQIFVYSMSSVQEKAPRAMEASHNPDERTGVANSRAVDSLSRLLTSVETFFHPSNFGVWTYALTCFLHRLAAEFSARWNDEQSPSCKTPAARRLTPGIKRAFVEILRTPTLLSMYSKDAIATTYAQGALKYLSNLDPDVIMPQLLEGVFNGLESINETHRTTASIGALSSVGSPLTNRTVWLKGQRHLVPLLDLCLPGIDINDATKTISTCLFIVTALQFVKIGDLRIGGAINLGHDAPSEDVSMTPEGSRTPIRGPSSAQIISEEEKEEDIAVRQAAAGFADWVVSFFRRIFTLYENLPEEGGRSGRTGGKSEESMLKSLNSAMDVVCDNLSDNLFDLALDVIHQYCISNARSNSVRSIGNMINSIARARPKETLIKFLPFCKRQIEIEMTAGASSIRTTSSGSLPAPSDTTLHWNLAILRATLTHGGPAIIDHKADILEIMTMLLEAKSERGYSNFGRMVNQVVATLTSTYITDNRVVNPKEWKESSFSRGHHQSWGKTYSDSRDVVACWHIPSPSEIEFALQIFNDLIQPIMRQLEDLLAIPLAGRDPVWLNDFCRYLYVVRSAFAGAVNLALESPKSDGTPCLDPRDSVAGLTPISMRPVAAFALPDAADGRNREFNEFRQRFGRLLHTIFLGLNTDNLSEKGAIDLVDASIQLARALDVYLLEYGMSRDSLTSRKRHFMVTRELIRVHPRQRDFPRLIWIKRAALYSYTRLFLHTINRDRSALDDRLLLDLVDLSLSPYTRLRKHAQSTLISSCTIYRRGWRLVLPAIVRALESESRKGKDADPDRQKGALHILSNKGCASMAYRICLGDYIFAVLHCRSQEKPSIQSLVGRAVQDSTSLTEELFATTSMSLNIISLDNAASDLLLAAKPASTQRSIIQEATAHRNDLLQKENGAPKLMDDLVRFAAGEGAHWRYQEYALRYILALIGRERPVSDLAMIFLFAHVPSEHPSLRALAAKSATKMFLHLRMRAFCSGGRELWLHHWRHPLRRDLSKLEISAHMATLENGAPSTSATLFIDKEQGGFLSWPPTTRAYAAPHWNEPCLTWDSATYRSLALLQDQLNKTWIDLYVERLSQEGTKANDSSSIDLRSDVTTFICYIFKILETKLVRHFLPHIDTLMDAEEKYKQRAGYEIIGGILRGSKHWPGESNKMIWDWTAARLPRWFDRLTPETITLWDGFLMSVMSQRDPRRAKPLLDFIFSQSIDFNAESTFDITRHMTSSTSASEAFVGRPEPKIPTLITQYFNNFDTAYAEASTTTAIRAQIAAGLSILITSRWLPHLSTPQEFMALCASEGSDPFQIRRQDYGKQVEQITEQLYRSRSERLPPPRVSQSTYDRVGMTFLQWVWWMVQSPKSRSIFPYAMPLIPEMMKMAELNDSSDLQIYSAGVLATLCSHPTLPEYVEPIINSLVQALKDSPSWRIRLHVLPALQVFYFRNLLNMPDGCATRVLDALLPSLRDENIEVRESAAKTLSGVIRCSERKSILSLKAQFLDLAERTILPRRQKQTNFADAVRTLHSAILGLCALLEAFPYSVEPWGPDIIEYLARHSSDPAPISTSIKTFAATFKQTHQDTWITDQMKFNEDQMQALATIVSGTSYYA